MLGLNANGWLRFLFWLFGWPVGCAFIGFFGALTYSAIRDHNAQLPSYAMGADTMLALLVSGAGLVFGLVISLVGAWRVYSREVERSRVG